MINTVSENKEWDDVLSFLKNRFDKEPDLKSILFLIGLRELGFRKDNLSKEQKQDVMNLAVCKILSFEGFFTLKAVDTEGWPIWEQTRPFPNMEINEQEEFLKRHVIQYFVLEKFI